MRQKIGGNANIFPFFPDRLPHLDRRPVVLLFPLNLASKRRGFLDDGEDRHHGVETEFGMPGAARRAIASPLRHASGNGASTRSMSSTVATDVGLQTGVRSTGSRRKAARTRSRPVIGATG